MPRVAGYGRRVTGNGLLVVGSGPGGISAAVAYRDAGGGGPVRVVSADVDAPYERPPLSKQLLRGESEADDHQLHPGAFYSEHGIELRLATTVRELDAPGQAVVLADGERLPYDTCVLATGAAPQRPSLLGAELDHTLVLRSLRDGVTLRDSAAKVVRAVVGGSGFIGCEAAASLAVRGVHVTLVTDEQRPQHNRLGRWAGDRIAEWLRAAGVEMVVGDRMAEVQRDRVRTQGGQELPADLVLFATGVKPRVELAEAAGLAIEDGRIRVDGSMRSSRRDVLALGDVALADNLKAGRPLAVEHWGEALAMGEIAGHVAAGADEQWNEVPGFWSTIGEHTLKYAAWGDGFDGVDVHERPEGGFTVWYRNGDRVVGVLTHVSDDDYDRGRELVGRGANWAERR